jgi:predicted NBD/HSP70 family sugar kinase
LVLRHVYDGTATSRAALALETGLSKPTISELVDGLISEGFLSEGGFGDSTDSGGKRPRLLRFVPSAREVIGLWLTPTEIMGVLTTLDGELIAVHAVEIGTLTPFNDVGIDEEFVPRLGEVVHGLIAQLDAPLLCIGIGSAGEVLPDGAIYAPRFSHSPILVGEAVAERLEVPVYSANSSALAAFALYSAKHRFKHQNPLEGVNERLAMLTISEGVGMGAVLESAEQQLGSEIGSMRVGGSTLDARLGWSGVRERALALGREHASPYLQTTSLNYLHIRHAAEQNDPAALMLSDELAAQVAEVCGWIITLLQPNHLAITGEISALGEVFLKNVRKRLPLSTQAGARVTFSIDELPNLAALGAAYRAIQMELGLV